MNTQTGKIHMMNEDENLDQLAKRIGVPKEHLQQLGNAPAQDCQRCKATGIKRITAKGRRIPCQCTNPATSL